MRVDEIAKALLAESSSCGVAPSLSHLAVVVPTAQSGRRLRLALAREMGAVLPPVVLTPPLLVESQDGGIATRGDEIAAFCAALGQGAEVAAQLSSVRAITGAAALSFADVAASAEFEKERWLDLAAAEGRYLAALAARGLKDRIEAMKEQIRNPAIAADLRRRGVKKLVVADVMDMLPAAGLVVSSLEREGFEVVRIERPAMAFPPARTVAFTPCATEEDEAGRIAEYFASVPAKEALPALCVADKSMFPKLQSAFESRGLRLRDPSGARLSTSSLGRLLSQIVDLRRSRSYAVFSAFIRGADVRRWLCGELAIPEDGMEEILVDLDNRQAQMLPEKMDDIRLHAKGGLRGMLEFVDAQLRKKSVRQMLQSIFKYRTLDGSDESSREFAAAAEAAVEILDECEGLERDGADAALVDEIAAIRISEAVYSLEPDEGEAVTCDGWLELPYLDADEIVIAGFQEGCVPEAVVGHPFLPDSLRGSLGLGSNESRRERDIQLLRHAVADRPDSCVRVFFHGVDSQGGFLKPSQLAFDTGDDDEFLGRVERFYGLRCGTPAVPPSSLPDSWKLALPLPPERTNLAKSSPTRLDSYKRCPFTYYLRENHVLGSRQIDFRAQELAADEFGNIVHSALEEWGNSELRDSGDAGEIAAFLEGKVDEILAVRFGAEIPAIVALQGESIKRRLGYFSRVQAGHRAEGWSVKATERKLQMTIGHTLFKGKCDRIDYNGTTDRWCVIDYKTWDELDRKAGEEARGSLQLKMYCAMLDILDEGDFAAAKLGNIEARYLVLGKTGDNVGFSHAEPGSSVADAEAEIRKLVDGIERGVFWPPSRKEEWKYDYARWLSPSPEEAVSREWIEDQERRLDLKGGKNV